MIRSAVAGAAGADSAQPIAMHGTDRAASRGPWLDRCLDRSTHLVAGALEVVGLLHAEPELRRGAKVAGEAEGGVRGDGARLPLTRSLMRISGTPSALARAYWLMARGSRKSWRSISPGWDGGKSAIGSLHSSLIVDDLDVERVTILPDEAEPPLNVDADAVLADLGQAWPSSMPASFTRWRWRPAFNGRYGPARTVEHARRACHRRDGCR